MCRAFDREALIAALRTDQAGKSTFPEFLAASWRAGVVRYDVDFAAREVAYYGANGRGVYRKLILPPRWTDDVQPIRHF